MTHQHAPDGSILHREIDAAGIPKVEHLGMHFVSESIVRNLLGADHGEPFVATLGMAGGVDAELHMPTGVVVKAAVAAESVWLFRMGDIARLRACIDWLMEGRPELADDFAALVAEARQQLDHIQCHGRTVQTVAEEAERAAEHFSGTAQTPEPGQ